MDNKSDHKPTLRVINILNAVSQADNGLTLTEIAEKIGSPKSSLFPIVHTLAEQRCLLYDSMSSRYLIGIFTFELGQRYLYHLNILDNIKDEMKKIVSVCNETCHFGILDHGDVFYIHKEDSLEPIRMFSSVGKRLPAYGTGIGKALLSDHTLSELKKLYPDGLLPITAYTITDFNELNKQLEQIRIENVSYEKEESNLHIQCVAVPIRKKNRVIAALSIAIPVFRYTNEKKELGMHLLLNAKENLENLIEYKDIDFSRFI